MQGSSRGNLPPRLESVLDPNTELLQDPSLSPSDIMEKLEQHFPGPWYDLSGNDVSLIEHLQLYAYAVGDNPEDIAASGILNKELGRFSSLLAHADEHFNAQSSLVVVKDDPDILLANSEVITSAALVALHAHRDEFRKTGLPYATHPIATMSLSARNQQLSGLKPGQHDRIIMLNGAHDMFESYLKRIFNLESNASENIFAGSSYPGDRFLGLPRQYYRIVQRLGIVGGELAIQDLIRITKRRGMDGHKINQDIYETVVNSGPVTAVTKNNDRTHNRNDPKPPSNDPRILRHDRNTQHGYIASSNILLARYPALAKLTDAVAIDTITRFWEKDLQPWSEKPAVVDLLGRRGITLKGITEHPPLTFTYPETAAV